MKCAYPRDQHREKAHSHTTPESRCGSPHSHHNDIATQLISKQSNPVGQRLEKKAPMQAPASSITTPENGKKALPLRNQKE